DVGDPPEGRAEGVAKFEEEGVERLAGDVAVGARDERVAVRDLTSRSGVFGADQLGVQVRLPGAPIRVHQAVDAERGVRSLSLVEQQLHVVSLAVLDDERSRHTRSLIDTGLPFAPTAERIVARCDDAGTSTVSSIRWSPRCLGNAAVRSKAKARPLIAGERSSTPQCFGCAFAVPTDSVAAAAAACAGLTFVQ